MLFVTFRMTQTMYIHDNKYNKINRRLTFIIENRCIFELIYLQFVVIVNLTLKYLGASHSLLLTST